MKRKKIKIFNNPLHSIRHPLNELVNEKILQKENIERINYYWKNISESNEFEENFEYNEEKSEKGIIEKEDLFIPLLLKLKELLFFHFPQHQLIKKILFEQNLIKNKILIDVYNNKLLKNNKLEKFPEVQNIEEKKKDLDFTDWRNNHDVVFLPLPPIPKTDVLPISEKLLKNNKLEKHPKEQNYFSNIEKKKEEESIIASEIDISKFHHFPPPPLSDEEIDDDEEIIVEVEEIDEDVFDDL